LKDLLVGIDAGTTGLKVSFYTVSGELVDGAYREYSLSLPGEGRVEVDPEVWWGRLCDSLSEVFARGRASAGDVAGIGITCTNSLVLLDDDKRALMPAVMQLDQRASAQAETLRGRFGPEWMFARTGNRVASGAFWGPTLQWVRENHPSLYTRARFFLTPTSFLLLRLTGSYCIDHSRASSTMLYNIHRKGWDDELCEALSLSVNVLPTIYKPHEIVGRVSAEGERATGFLEGTPAIAGAMDTIGALVGLGFGSENGALVMGSVGRLCIETDDLDDRFMNTVNAQVSSSLSMTSVNSAGLSYKWLKNLLFRDHEAESNVYKAMDEMAEAIRPGSEGRDMVRSCGLEIS
jgi:xylulokinase